jgi:hypothetical protein
VLFVCLFVRSFVRFFSFWSVLFVQSYWKRVFTSAAKQILMLKSINNRSNIVQNPNMSTTQFWIKSEDKSNCLTAFLILMNVLCISISMAIHSIPFDPKEESLPTFRYPHQMYFRKEYKGWWWEYTFLIGWLRNHFVYSFLDLINGRTGLNHRINCTIIMRLTRK